MGLTLDQILQIRHQEVTLGRQASSQVLSRNQCLQSSQEGWGRGCYLSVRGELGYVEAGGVSGEDERFVQLVRSQSDLSCPVIFLHAHLSCPSL